MLCYHWYFVFSSGFVPKHVEMKFTFKFELIVAGLVPGFEHIGYSTREPDRLRFWMCVKQSDINVVTFASDLRAPFIVISSEFAKVNIIISVSIKCSSIRGGCTFQSISIKSSLFQILNFMSTFWFY